MMRPLLAVTIAIFVTLLLVRTCPAAPIVFDFESTPVHTPFPITVSSGGLTATLSGTGQGYSIQLPTDAGVTPNGFAGHCVFPNSIFPADLVVAFSPAVTDFSILYAPQELNCSTSATLRATGYTPGAGGADVQVATNTTTCSELQIDTASGWPSNTLALAAPAGQSFSKVVVHYASPPPTGGDYGVIFMADNLAATAVVPEPITATLLPIFVAVYAGRRGGSSRSGDVRV